MSTDRRIRVEVLREEASAESLKLSKIEELNLIIVVDLQETRVNRSWTQGESAPRESEGREFESPEARIAEANNDRWFERDTRR